MNHSTPHAFGKTGLKKCLNFKLQQTCQQNWLPFFFSFDKENTNYFMPQIFTEFA